MNKATGASQEIRSIESLNRLDSTVHNLSPLSKFILTMVYIVTAASFNRYDIFGIFAMLLIPLVGYTLSLIPVSLCFRKMKYVLPIVMLVGIINPFLDREIALTMGRVPISYGVISMLTLMLKGIFSVMASFLLVATTPVDELCRSLRKIHAPKLIVSLLLLTYRYIFVFLDEVSVMTDCYALRAPGQKGIAFSAWGSFLGGLIVRSEGKASGNYDCMLLRGFNGEFEYSMKEYSKLSWLWVIILIALIITVRLINIPMLLGMQIVR